MTIRTIFVQMPSSFDRFGVYSANHVFYIAYSANHVFYIASGVQCQCDDLYPLLMNYLESSLDGGCVVVLREPVV
jgi:hypothetical protein